MKEILLKLLNWLERTPSEYARIDNIRFYSRRFLDESDKTQTLGEFLETMDKMDRCMKSGKNCVIKNGIVYKDVDLEKEIS